MAADEDDAERSLRTLRESLIAIAPALQESSTHAATIQSFLPKKMGPIYARSIESLLTSIESKLQGAASDLTSASEAIIDLRNAQALHESRVQQLEEDRKTLQSTFDSKATELEEMKKTLETEYQDKCQTLETEQQKLETLKKDCKSIWDDKIEKVEQERESLKTARAQCAYDHNKVKKEKASIVHTLQSTSAHHALVMRLRRSLKDRLDSMEIAEEKATSHTSKMSASTTSMTVSTAAMTETSTKMSESTAAMTAATNEFKAFRNQSQQTILQKDTEIAQLKLDLQTAQDNATRHRATLVDAHQRQLRRVREGQAAAEGTLRELRITHNTGLHHTMERMMDAFERFHGDATAAENSRTEQRALLVNLNDLAATLSTSASGIQTSANTLQMSSTSIQTSLAGLQALQGLLKTSASDLKTSLGGMKALSDGVRSSLGIFTKQQQIFLANDHEARAAITAMDAARWQMQEVRQSFTFVKDAYLAKGERYEDLTFALEADRDELEADRREFEEEEARHRSEYERARGDLADEWKIYHAMVASLPPKDTEQSTPQKRRREDVPTQIPKRQRFEQILQDEEESRVTMAGNTLVERTSPSNADGQEAMPCDEYECQPLLGDEDIVIYDPLAHEAAAAPLMVPDPILEFAPEIAVDAALETTSETDEETTTRAVAPRSPSAVATPPPVTTTAAPPQDVVDQIFGLFDTPTGWTRAKCDELLAHFRGKYHGKSFEDIKVIMDKAANWHPRFDAALKCLVFQGYKDGKSCVPKEKANTRANCPRHGSTTAGLCLIISKAEDSSPYRWVLTDRV